MQKLLPALAVLALLMAATLTPGTPAVADDKDAKPGDTVKAFAKAMEANDPKTVGELVPQLKELAGEEKIKEMVKEASEEIKAEGGIKSITIDKEEIDGDKAKVTATLESGTGEKDTSDFDLRKQDGKWVIYMDLEGKPVPEEEE